uniref:PEHE domain-containing protein n=1 Tax=Bombyx mori TaxID=7091 RepID=A0A8R2QU63_BOMMO|nr:MSL1 protein isoform X1 [Bombyx mori]
MAELRRSTRLRTKLNRMDKKVTINQRPNLNLPPPSANVPTPAVTSTVVKSEPNQVMFNSLTELLLPDNRTNPYYFNSDLNKSKTLTQEPFNLPKVTETDVTSYLPSDLTVPPMSILDTNINLGDNFNMIENKPFVKKEVKSESKPEPLYTVTSNSGNPIIQKLPRSRRRTGSGIGSLSRMPKSSATKTEKPETSKPAERPKKYERTNYSVHKKSKMINTYGKTKGLNAFKKTTQVTGSLSERLKLIDTTPTGEDPYQLGEADLREQSPIPKLMLQKSNRNRRCTETSTRRIYDPAIPETSNKPDNKVNTDRFSSTNTFHDTKIKKDETKTVIVEEPDLDIVKTEPEIDWRTYASTKAGNETSLCDFSYGENPNNIHIPSIDSMEFQDLFAPDASLNLDNLTAADFGITDKPPADKTKKRVGRTPSVMTPTIPFEEPLAPITPVLPVVNAAPDVPIEMPTNKRGGESKRGRKRAFSATGVTKGVKRDAHPKPSVPKPKPVRGKTTPRGKKSPVPGKTTKKSYHSLMGDPDISWYLGLDPDVKPEDVDEPRAKKAATVEVPRWREKPYTSCYTLEGTENLDDKVFEKRHQKLEAEERRQLRWHMRRIREQRHVERLRQRQRDWCGNSSFSQQPSVYTIWPQPQRDARFIEITDMLPVMAFGEILPDLPESDFKLPWIRSSRCLKRSKRSKTLH